MKNTLPVPGARRRVIVAAAVVAAASFVLAADAQQQRPRFTTEVELVQLQVGVGDLTGGFVRGLTTDDFVVLVDGDPRPARVVYEIDLRTEDRRGVAAMAGPPPRVAPRPVAARRHFLFLFDFSFTDRRGVLEARRSALQFVEQNIRTSDLVSVATANRYGINLLTPFTSNHEKIDEAIGTLGLADASDIITAGFDAEESIAQALAEAAAGPAGDAGSLSQLGAIDFRQYVANVTDFTTRLQQFGKMLQAIEGRKHVVMFSRGFADRALTGAGLDELGAQQDARASSPAAVADADPEMSYGAAEVRDGMREAIAMFRNADAVIYSVDPGGLRQGRDGRQALTMFAEDTGGAAYWNMNDLTVALNEIEEATASFYMIAYSKKPEDSGTVDIEVQVKRPGIRVTSAPARLTPPPAFQEMNEMQRQMQVAELMADDVDRREIEFDSQVMAFPALNGDLARAALVLEINGLEVDRLARMRGVDEIQLEIAGFALADDDTVLDEFRRRITVDVATMRETGNLYSQAFRYSDYVDVPAGEGRLRVLLREAEVGELSASTRPYFARAATAEDGVIVARPLIVDDVTVPPLPDPDAPFDPLEFEGRRFAPIAAPSAAPGDTIQILVIAYNLPANPETGAVAAGLAIELEESVSGDSHRIRDFRIVGTSRSDAAGATRMLVNVPIPGHVRPGEARLWARVIDQVAGTRQEEQTALYINPQ